MTDTTQAAQWKAAQAAVSDNVLAKLDGPTETVRGLPNQAFTSEAFHDLEKKHLFPRGWVFAGRAEEISQVGDARPVEVAGHPLILVCGKDRQVRVFHNVCLHRGARLLAEPVSGVRALTCVYHRWAYELDGALRGRPHYHGLNKHDAGEAGGGDACLFSVRSHVWHDWVFVNIDGQAPDFEDYLGPALTRFEGYNIGSFRCDRHESYEFASNWKLAVENYCDYYHVYAVHPALHQMMDHNYRQAMQIEGRHLINFYPLATEGHGITPESNAPGLPDQPDLAPDKKNLMTYIALFPNTALNVYPSNAQFVTFDPVAPDRCVMNIWFYYVGDAAHEAAYAGARDEVAAEWGKLNAEDEDVCARMQLGRQSAAYDGGRFAPFWDGGTAHFHRMIAHAVRGDGPFAPLN